MHEWWLALTLIEKIFLYIAVPSTVLLVLQTILLLIGLGHGDSDVDTGHDGTIDYQSGHDFSGDGHDDLPDVHADDGLDSHEPHDGGLRIFTIRGFVAFFTVFGWGGLTFLQAGMPSPVAGLIAFALGVASMLLIAFILRSFLKLQSDGTVNIQNAIGKSGTVYLSIPASRSQKGKVAILVQERLCEFDAVTDSETQLKTGSEVVVTAISGNDTLVVKVK